MKLYSQLLAKKYDPVAMIVEILYSSLHTNIKHIAHYLTNTEKRLQPLNCISERKT